MIFLHFWVCLMFLFVNANKIHILNYFFKFELNFFLKYANELDLMHLNYYESNLFIAI
jgi:hypothetical protein